MLIFQTHHLLEVKDSQFEAIKNVYRLSEDALGRDVNALISWFEKQPHLPNIVIDRSLVQYIYIANKCSIERTKEKLDFRFTKNIVLPEFFTNRDAHSTSIQNAFKGLAFSPMRKLCPDNERLSVIKFSDPNPEMFNFILFFKVIFMISEIRLHCDCAFGDRLLLDLKGVSVGHILKLNPNDIRKADLAHRKTFGGKLLGIHIINGPPFIEHLLTMLRQALPKKLGERIKVHLTLDDLYKHIPKEILPKDYNGFEPYFSEIVDNWRQELSNEEFRKHLLEQDKLLPDETKRPASCKINSFDGIEGSFKKLDID